MLKSKLKEMKVVLFLVLAFAVGSRTLSQRADESGVKLKDGEEIWEGDMILTKEQVEELYGKEPETSDRDKNHPVERHNQSTDFGAGLQLREGDMLLSEDQIQAVQKRGLTDGRTLWPHGVVSYEIDSSANMHKDNILEAIRIWEELTCIKFIDRTQSTSYSVFFGTNQSKPDDCSSLVGMNILDEVGQKINLGINCGTVGIVLHEIGHAIGFLHEQSRMDRDNFVKILEKNVEKDKLKNNFDKEKSLHDFNGIIPYDHESLMHYKMTEFSKNGNSTVIPYRPEHTLEMGQRENLTFTDIKLANLMYKCSVNCSKAPSCEHEGFVDKNCKCYCPKEYNGTNCEHKLPPAVPACGGKINDTGFIQTPNYPWNPPKGTKCMWEFKPPTGQSVKLTFLGFKLSGRNSMNVCGDEFHIRGEGFNGEHIYCRAELNQTTITIGPHENGTFVIYKFYDDTRLDPDRGFKAYVTFV